MPSPFSLFRRNVIRPHFPETDGLLAKRVYSASKHSDRLILVKALADAWLGEYNGDKTRECFFQALFQLYNESGRAGLAEVRQYLRNKRDTMEGNILSLLAGKPTEIEFGDFFISSRNGFHFVIGLEASDSDSLRVLSLAEALDACQERHDRVLDLYEGFRDFKASLNTMLIAPSEVVPDDEVASAGIDADSIPVARPISF